MLEQLPNNGAWWLDPWWRDPQYSVADSLEPTERAMNFLRIHFDDSWARSTNFARFGNLVFRSLFLERGAAPLRFLVSLSNMLSSMEGSSGLQRIIRGLKGDKSQSSYQELEAGWAFHSDGFVTSFPTEGRSPSCDIFATKNDLQVGIECKSLREERWELWASETMQQLLWSKSFSLDGQNVAIDIRLHSRLPEVRIGDNTQELDAGIVHELEQAIVNRVEHALQQRHTLPITFDVAGLASVQVFVATSENLGSVAGIETSEPALFRRIMQKGILQAAIQLPHDRAGVAVIYSSSIPQSAMFSFLWRAACKHHRGLDHVAAVVLCPRQTIFRRVPPQVFPNPVFADVDARSSLCKLLVAKYGAILVSECF